MRGLLLLDNLRIFWARCAPVFLTFEPNFIGQPFSAGRAVTMLLELGAMFGRAVDASYQINRVNFAEDIRNLRYKDVCEFPYH